MGGTIVPLGALTIGYLRCPMFRGCERGGKLFGRLLRAMRNWIRCPGHQGAFAGRGACGVEGCGLRRDRGVMRVGVREGQMGLGVEDVGGTVGLKWSLRRV